MLSTERIPWDLEANSVNQEMNTVGEGRGSNVPTDPHVSKSDYGR